MTDLAAWRRRPAPQRQSLIGRFVTLEPLNPARHGPPMFRAHRDGDPDGQLWTYLPYGPFTDYDSYMLHLSAQAACSDPLFFAVVDKASREAVGVLSLLNIRPDQGVAEVGHLCYTPRLQRTPGGSEAVLRLGALLFDQLGYRRYEWKCDAGNAPSRAAAERFGFLFEGIFRKHGVVKGRNRDTAWFAMTDDEWPAVRAAMEGWLAADNFDASGHQKTRFGEFLKSSLTT